MVHDFLYYTAGKGVWGKKTWITRDHPYERAEADWILRDAMRDRCVGAFVRNVIYDAVRIGGASGWGH